MNTRKLRESIENRLQEVTQRPVYHRAASATAKAPFSVYSLRTVRLSQEIAQYELMIDVSDYGHSPGSVEAICDAITEAFDHCYYADDDQSWASYLNVRSPIDEADKNIQRERITLEIRYYL